jgi:ABC-2 type transport system permease protein
MRPSDASRSRDAIQANAFPYLLLPVAYTLRNRIARRERGDLLRFVIFGGIGLFVSAALFAMTFWFTWQAAKYEELGEYLVRLTLSWLFLVFLSFLAFSGLVVSLSTFFLSDDLWLLMATPTTSRRLFYSRFVRTCGQASWMVIAFLLPALLAIGMARCASPLYYLMASLALPSFVVIPVALGCAATLLLVNTFPARRTRDILILAGLAFTVALVLLLRFLRPEQLLNVRSLPDVTAFFTAIESRWTPLLPSFWVGETLFSALHGRVDWLHLGCLLTTALALTLLLRIAFDKHYFTGWSKAQEARKARFTHLSWLEHFARFMPLAPVRRSLFLKDIKVFLRDTTQWSQLLLLLALAFIYLYNFHVLDLSRIPYISGLVKSAYAFLNLTTAAFILAAVAVRLVFPAVSIEGASFWIIRSAPVAMRSFLWMKFWTGLLPTLLLAEFLTILSNEFMGADPFLKIVSGVAIFFMSFSLVGLAAGMGASYPLYRADNPTQVASSFGGVAYMVLAVFFILTEVVLLAWPTSIYLWHFYRDISMSPYNLARMIVAFSLAAVLAVLVFWIPMFRGVQALERSEE